MTTQHLALRPLLFAAFAAACALGAACTQTPDSLPPTDDAGLACIGLDFTADPKNCGSCNHACAEGATCQQSHCTPHWDTRYVINRFIVPRAPTDFAIDLDGDGTPDNQFGAFCAALVAIGLDAQPILDATVKVGANLDLIHLQTTFVGAPCSGCLGGNEIVAAKLLVGASMMHPELRGNGPFTVDASQPSTSLLGAIPTLDFASNNPLKAPANSSLTSYGLPIAFGFSGVPPLLFVPLNAAHTQFHLDANNLTVSNGQIHGAIKMADVTGKLIPALAASLTAQLQQTESMVPTDVVMAMIQQFDQGGTDGGCANPDGSRAKIGDGQVDYCEVSTNPTIAQSLVPDVQLFDASGHFAPVPHSTNKDSISFGIGFTGATAKFSD